MSFRVPVSKAETLMGVHLDILWLLGCVYVYAMCIYLFIETSACSYAAIKGLLSARVLTVVV